MRRRCEWMRGYGWVVLAVAAAVSLGGCGLKGPLYLPGKTHQASAAKAPVRPTRKANKVGN